MRQAGRAATAAGLLILASACREEPDFDERYQAAQEKIRDKAAELDKQLAKAQREQATKDARTAPPREPGSGD